MAKILITGALGNVGKYVAKYLIKNKEPLALADIYLEKMKEVYGVDADCRYFDYTDSTTFEKVLEDVDRVFIIRPPHLGEPKDIKPFIEMLDPNKIKLIVFLSLIGIEKNPVPPHYKIEKYIEKSGCNYCHIRPSFFMQNISGIHAFEIKHFDKIVVPVKKAKTSFIDAEDIGEMIAHIMINYEQHTNQAYSITGPDALDYYDVAKILSGVLNRTIAYANPKPGFAKKYWVNVRNIDAKYAKVMGLLYMMTRFGTAKRTTNTYEKIMGKKPTKLESFVRKNQDAWI
jgi:uncharacterized protein YbjT (DUF2867 family)